MRYSKKLVTINPSASMKAGLDENSKNSVNLGIGVSDLQAPDCIAELMKHFIKSNKYPYTPSLGTLKARRNIYSILYPSSQQLSFNNFLLVNGAKWGISLALSTICNLNDTVILMEPYWLSYPSICSINNLLNISWCPEVTDDGELIFSIETLHKIIENNSPRVLILNNPNNPSGKIFSNNFIKEVVEICNERDIWVIIDEVYRDLTFNIEDRSCDEEIYNSLNVITVGSFSKSLSIPGLRLGYIRSNETFITNADLINQHLLTCISSLTNVVAENINANDYYNFTSYASKVYEDRYMTFVKNINGNLIKSKASFYVLVSPKRDFINGIEICSRLANEDDLICTPGIHYGKSFANYIRVCLTVNRDIIKIAALKINSLFIK